MPKKINNRDVKIVFEQLHICVTFYTFFSFPTMAFLKLKYKNDVKFGVDS